MSWIKLMPALIYQLHRKAETLGERGLPKYPVETAYLTRRGLDGDFNRYRHEKKKDNPDQALLIMPLEMIQQLHEEGWPVQPGHLGENITSRGIPYHHFQPGKMYQVGQAKIQISEPCTPCTNLHVLPYVGTDKIVEFMRILAKPTNRRGWYARVLKEGMLRKGDTIEEILKQT